MKKFKPIIEDAPETPVEELSVNQKRKIEVQKKKEEIDMNELSQALSATNRDGTIPAPNINPAFPY